MFYPPERCDRTWIQTATGRQFWPLNPRAWDVCVTDIAHALANKCRFTGHSREFYSVAQHSVLAANLAGSDTNLARWALLHDAAEAYLPDVARPIKPHLAGFREIESRIMDCIAERFGLAGPMPAQVHEIDLILLATERRDLMGSPWPWPHLATVDPAPEAITPWSPWLARYRFLEKFSTLFEW